MPATTDGKHRLVYVEKQNSLPNCLTFSHSGSSSSACDIQIQKQMSRSFGKFFPQKIVLPKLRSHCSATCLNTWRAEPQKKNTLSFFKKKATPAKPEMQGVFFLSGLLAYSPVRGASVHSSSFRSKKVRAKCIITAQNLKAERESVPPLRRLYCTKLAPISKTNDVARSACVVKQN